MYVMTLNACQKAPLGSRPLLEWSLNAMLAFGGFDSIWVSTDHPDIAACASAMQGVQGSIL
jgi:CMP-N-acetylneuraminic acid synthetase